MVGLTVKGALEVQKSPSVLQCVEVMRHFFDELQTQTWKGPFTHRKTAPSGLFCMSGPVAHADDDDDGEDDCESDVVQMQKEALSLCHPLDEKLGLAKRNDSSVEASLPNRSDRTECLQLDHTVKYCWADGCMYEGEWGFDKHTGRVKIYWPSGSCYEGEAVGGNLHGVGTFRGADGTVYKGNWILNKKHGFGRKRYANGDVYEGTWKWDLPEGQGCYFWGDGSEYYGGWKGGLMSGRGVLAWSSGDTYDGQWLNGLADRCGVYTWEDGSTYFGTWRKGLKHGQGRFYPPGSKYAETERLHYAYSVYRKEDFVEGEMDFSQSPCRQKICSPSHLPQELRRLCQGSPVNRRSFDALGTSKDANEESHPHLEKLWSLDSSEECAPRLDADDCAGWASDGLEESVSGRRDNFLWEAEECEQNCQLSEQKRFGEIIFKGHRSYDLMLNLQLGIRYSVGKVTPEKKRKLVLADFGPKSRLRVNFPREGSQLTPPHQSADFKWKDYCPMVFRYLRETFKIDAADYMLSICGSAGLRELSSPGKSGSVFYVSEDERFMIKTLRKAEVKVLLRMLPRYYNHVRMHKNTLLTRCFGLHRIKVTGGVKVRFIVMGNVVSTDACIHRRFDLKGSSQGRSTEKNETSEGVTLKDLDLDLVFQLDPSWRDAVLEQISRDCQFLECEHIMDYSLLLGLHFKNAPSCSTFSGNQGSVFSSPLQEAVKPKSVAHTAWDFARGGSRSHTSRWSGLEEQSGQTCSNPSTDEPAKSDLSSPQTERCNTRIGSNMPAKAFRRQGNGIDIDSNEVYDVVLYFGIIDILQEYDMGKKLEHAYKSLHFDSLSISAVDPALYSKRFRHFINGIFSANTQRTCPSSCMLTSQA